MRALIVDDERLARVELRRLLTRHPEVQIAGESASGEDAVAEIAKLAPDILFLDIQMPGMTGFELLERLDDVPAVIFTTAYDEFAIKAFEVNAIDYLLKPIAPERLAAALARVKLPAPASGTAGPHLAQIFVRDGDRCWMVRLADVFLIESEGNYARLCFGTERPLIRRSLNALEERLDPVTFFRANRTQIINMRAIQRIDGSVGGGLVATLRDGRAVEVSRRQAARLRDQFGY